MRLYDSKVTEMKYYINIGKTIEKIQTSQKFMIQSYNRKYLANVIRELTVGTAKRKGMRKMRH